MATHRCAAAVCDVSYERDYNDESFGTGRHIDTVSLEYKCHNADFKAFPESTPMLLTYFLMFSYADPSQPVPSITHAFHDGGAREGARISKITFSLSDIDIPVPDDPPAFASTVVAGSWGRELRSKFVPGSSWRNRPDPSSSRSTPRAVIQSCPAILEHRSKLRGLKGL